MNLAECNSSLLEEYKDYITIYYADYQKYSRHELFTHLKNIDSFINLIQYYIDNISLYEIYAISEYALLIGTTDFYFIWYNVSTSSKNYIEKFGFSSCSDRDEALRNHYFLKDYFDKLRLGNFIV